MGVVFVFQVCNPYNENWTRQMCDLNILYLLKQTTEIHKDDQDDDATWRRTRWTTKRWMTREQMTVEDAGCREHRGKGNVYGDGQSQSQPRFDDPEQNKMSHQIQ